MTKQPVPPWRNRNYDRYADWRSNHPAYRSDQPKRCEKLAHKGTGTGICDRPLDERGQCDRAGDHVLED